MGGVYSDSISPSDKETKAQGKSKDAKYKMNGDVIYCFVINVKKQPKELVARSKGYAGKPKM
ncbi:hypothetical protein SBF1_1110049 [Candidatus Desulfosporosinus infrequens]|uniref:Uncharacterized protein n=1 Tax=Candidatus Desulfosporosinus infrequens TaxID=2043169 RepID=A0A2U3JYG3_9FIRM|nr:hypothetical protein SBF1_1110049 [Candidatus Desulfosporosinus infrequens]